MALEKIIEIADKAYGDGLVDLCAADAFTFGWDHLKKEASCNQSA